jgi:phenylpropionate dioxygenase-like ring-hydroxylating dioxygenase large terminal subunit
MAITLDDQERAEESGERPRRRTPTPSEMRDLVPALGLREYWYPALLARTVGPGKPVGVKLLGEELVFFRGADGEVRALAAVCPHRGAALSRGDCHFAGTVSCAYHGWTFNAEGECIAVLSEGPESHIPGKVRTRAYPTRTLKGMVWVWMGDGEPADVHEDIPPEFFEGGDTMVFYAINYWPLDWRVSMENSMDSHVPYVHRDALLSLRRPIMKGRPRTVIPKVVNGRAIVGVRPERPNGAVVPQPAPAAEPAYQDYYPALGGYWPKHRWRLLWTWLFDRKEKHRAQMPPFHDAEEWGRDGQLLHHLPSMFRYDHKYSVYTRYAVPVDEKTSRMIYFHAVRIRNPLARAWEHVHFRLFYNWAMNANFSRQDLYVMQEQRYDRPEKLSGTDAEIIAWRKLWLRARGMPQFDFDLD